MPRSAKIFTSIIVITIINVLTCFSQGCDSPCDISAYAVAQVVEIKINECLYMVQFRSRASCIQSGAPIYDVYIEAIFTSDPNCPIKYPDGIIDETAIVLMQHNPMGFPPESPGQSGARWRIARLVRWSPMEEFYTGRMPAPCNTIIVDVDYNGDDGELRFNTVE